MLTKREREWLEDRKHKAYCRYCSGSKLCANPFASGFSCPLAAGNMKDALEFSERVVVKLAEFYHHTTLYLDDSDGQKLRCWETCPARFYCGDSYTHLTCGDAVLKTAQLAAEEEMDGEAR
jgi:hypothetical protein